MTNGSNSPSRNPFCDNKLFCAPGQRCTLEPQKCTKHITTLLRTSEKIPTFVLLHHSDVASLAEASFPSHFQLFSTCNSNRYPHLSHLHGVGPNATVASRAFLYSDAQWRHPGNLNTPARLGIKTWDGGGEREAWTVWWLK